jgi:hypothetical protein
VQKKLGPLANGEFGQPAAVAASLLRDRNVGTVAWYRAVLAGAADRLEQLEQALIEIRQLGRKIEDVEIRNISDDARLTLVAKYNQQIAEVCRRLLPD